MGGEVVITMAGSPLNGVRTRVTGKTTDEHGQRLYRLEWLSEGMPVVLTGTCLMVAEPQAVIRATAVQLRQVLGKACPFVGPGLWTVKRDEVPVKAWGQLCRLVEEM